MFKIFRRKRRLRRDDLIALLYRLVLDSGVSTQIFRDLTPELRNRLGSPSRIETQLLDLWLVHEALIHSSRLLSDAQLRTLIDSYHLEVYKRLLSSGYADSDLVELQGRVQTRYREYTEAVSEVLAGKGPFRFCRVVTHNLFKAEIDDPSVALRVALRVSAMLFATVDALKEAIAHADFR